MPGGNRKRKHLRTATVVATSSNGCDLIVIHQEDFQQFIAPHGSGATFFAWRLISWLARIVVRMSD